MRVLRWAVIGIAFLLALGFLCGTAGLAQGIQIRGIRIDQPSSDPDEYFEIMGDTALAQEEAAAAATAPVEGSVPVIDIHAHVFNFHHLPVRGILRARGVPRLVSKIASSWLNNHTKSDDLDPSTARQELTDRERRILRSHLESQVEADDGVTSLAISSAGAGLEGDEQLIQILLDQSEFDPNPVDLSGDPDLTEADLRTEGLKGYAKFLRIMKNRETELVDDLGNAYPEVNLMVHHMMDMQRSYGNDKPVLSFERQVARMPTLTRGSQGRLLTFVAYDPFRGPAGLSLVQKAWKAGAIGVKVYPPSGYSATDNVLPGKPRFGHAKKRWRVRYGDLEDGSELDERLEGLYAWAEKNHVPLLAHTTPQGFEAEKGFGLLADPAYWEGVLKDHPKLILAFAHAGGGAWWFGRSGDNEKAQRQIAFAKKVVELCMKYPNVYSGLGYFDEVLDEDQQGTFRRHLETLAEESGEAVMSKLMYGTDWHMISKVKYADQYLTAFDEVFDQPGQLRRWRASFFAGNAVRFLRLGDQVDRLAKLGEKGPLTNDGVEYLRQLVERVAAAENAHLGNPDG